MPTQQYKLKDGSKVPGVTTVISASLGWNKGALMHWAWAQGKEGLDYRATKDLAAEAGTIAHALVELHLRGKDEREAVPAGTDPDVEKKARTAYGAFLEFEAECGLKVLEVEKALVSEAHKFGGCIDIASIKNKIAIVDVKTSRDVYPDHRIQLAAYGRLWNENYPERRIEAYYIIQLGKNDGSFAYHYYPNLDDEWEAFLLLLRLYQLKKALGG